MVFNSYTFVLFFAIVLLIHNLPLAWRWRKLNLLIASYLFYASWNPAFVLLLWASTGVDWFVGGALPEARTRVRRRALLLTSLGVNLGMLGFFKYGSFLLENQITLLRLFGIEFQPVAPDILLPVGISFYTFQTLSYTLEIYYGRSRPWNSFLDYALFVTFFPQLVAGPIVRAVNFLPQCIEPVRVTARQLGWGLCLLTLGVAEKVILADRALAPVASALFESHRAPTFVSAWIGTLAFSGQIFFDFSGYSIGAIGVALCLGFTLRDNFRFPYAAIGFSDFWRRWHISLSSWLRDYLYIPMGGNRRGSGRRWLNLMLTMLVGGLWHGASWTFVVWGGLHGFYLVAESLAIQLFGAARVWTTRSAQFALALLTFTLVTIAWVFFRAQSFGQALEILSAMLGGADW